LGIYHQIRSIWTYIGIPKPGLEKTPYELFTNGPIDHMRDFCVKWGVPVLVKKPTKGIASDLTITRQWGAVVRHMMNGTGLLNVYLVQ